MFIIKFAYKLPENKVIDTSNLEVGDGWNLVCSLEVPHVITILYKGCSKIVIIGCL